MVVCEEAIIRKPIQETCEADVTVAVWTSGARPEGPVVFGAYVVHKYLCAPMQLLRMTSVTNAS